MARDRATTPSRLVAAAAEVFEEKGYRNSTIDDIAEAAGISRPTVYKYAKSKLWLLDRIVEIVMSDLEVRQRSVINSPGPPLHRLRSVIDTHVEAAATNRTFYAIVFSEETELSPEARSQFRTGARSITYDFQSLLKECVTVGALPSTVDTWTAANLILSMLTSLYRWYDPTGDIAPSQLTDQILQVIGIRGD